MPESAEPFEPFIAFYREEGVPPPRLGSVSPGDMLEPYRRLLVHERAMTPTLEAFLGQRLTLRVLCSREEGDTLWRQVVLVGAGDGAPVELGAVRIDLACFDTTPRELLREGRTPLGTLLREFKVAYVCRPTAFFSVEADARVLGALELGSGTQPLFGRCNRILTPDGRVMADVVEVLAPVLAARTRRALRVG